MRRTGKYAGGQDSHSEAQEKLQKQTDKRPMLFIKSKQKAQHCGRERTFPPSSIITYLSTSSFHNRYKGNCCLFCSFWARNIIFSLLVLSPLALLSFFNFVFPFLFHFLLIYLFFISLCFTLFQQYFFLASAQKNDCFHPLSASFSGIAERVKWSRTFAYAMELFFSLRSAMFLAKQF